MRFYYILHKNSIGHLLRISWHYFRPPPPKKKSFIFFPLQLIVGERVVQKAVFGPPLYTKKWSMQFQLFFLLILTMYSSFETQLIKIKNHVLRKILENSANFL